MLTAAEIRQKYLTFFERHGHAIVTSGPLIPPNDKSLLFTNAGMVQFKKLFLGAEKRSYSRATTCQKCLRVSGKHNDLENVGRTARHHTFFEMLGNFSFGDYFKREAITWAWQFVTEELELPKEKLWVTIYREDEEAFALWQEVAGLPTERIVRMGEKDNFWTMGDTGPCGPCSEIYVDQGEELSCGPNCGIGRCDCDRFLEIWNLVFTQFDQAADGTRALLAAPNIDTGMGLERIAAICQGKKSNFDCDLFQDLIQYAAKLAHVTYQFSAPNTNDGDTALRVIADHSRSAAFLIAEGVLPSNESRGYVLRRLLRRALRFARLLGVREPFLYKVVEQVVAVMGASYPELIEQKDFLARVVFEEEERFSVTLDNGMQVLESAMEKLKHEGATTIPGDLCFLLHDTHGFPLDIVTDMAEKRGFTVDVAGFETLMQEQRTRARANQKKAGLLGQGADLEEIFKRLAAGGLASRFVGYGTLEAKSSVTLLLNMAGEEVAALGEGEMGYVVTSATPFYGESGGQVGDQGVIKALLGEATVATTVKPVPTLLLHQVTVTRGELHKNDAVELCVLSEKRAAIARNHTCTHLLHAALREVLGTHVHQMGSLVDAEHLRFDFSHLAAMTAEELEKVESLVNRAILQNLPVTTEEMDRAAAEASGAMALFEEKYGETVRVVCVGAKEQPTSLELCGGTHLRQTGEAGCFLILAESGVASGTRRIEAITGFKALQYMREQRSILANLSSTLKVKPEDVAQRVQTLTAEIKQLRKDAEKASAKNVSVEELVKGARQVNGIQVLAADLSPLPMKSLRSVMDTLRTHLSSNAVLCLGSCENEGKVSVLLAVSKDLHDRFTAPRLIQEVAKEVGGSGGGRPDLAQAGGSDPSGLKRALAKVSRLLD